MTDRVHFELSYGEGRVHRFGATLNSAFVSRGLAYTWLYDVVMQNAYKYANGRPFELFWRDDESIIVLESEADLSTAIDFAKSMMKTETDTPCVHLVLSIKETADEEEEEEEESQQLAIALDDEANEDAVEVDLLVEIKQRLLILLDSALEEQWTAGLQAAMMPLFCPTTGKLQKPSEICGAEIAVQLFEVEKKISDEFMSLLDKFPGSQLRELLSSDWMEQKWKERQSNDKMETMSNDQLLAAATAVRLAVELNIDIFDKAFVEKMKAKDEKYKQEHGEDSEDEPEDDDEDSSSGSEDEDEEEDETVIHPKWITTQAKALVAIAEDRRKTVSEKWPRDYPSPEEFLERTRSAAAAAAAGTVDVAPALDRVSRFKEHVHQQKESAEAEEPCWKLISEMERDSRYALYRGTEEGRPIPRKYYETMERKTAALLSRTVERIPEELERELESLSPAQLARVILLDWKDRMVEEKRTFNNLQTRNLPTTQMMTYCSHKTLHDLLFIGLVAQIYPEEMREQAKLINKKFEERQAKKRDEEDKDLTGMNLEAHQAHEVRIALMNELGQYMAHYKESAFEKYMLPPRKWVMRAPRDDSQDHVKWAKLIDSLGMTQEMRKYTSQSDAPEVQKEIAGLIYGLMHKFSKRTFRSWHGCTLGLIANVSLYIFRKHLRKKDRSIKKQQKNPPTDAQELKPNNVSPAMLAALFFMYAVEQNNPEEAEEDLSKLRIRKSDEQWCSEEAKAMEKLRSEDPNSAPIPPAKTKPAVVLEWIDRHSAKILSEGREKLAHLLVPPTQIPPVQPPANPVMQPTAPSYLQAPYHPVQSNMFAAAPSTQPVCPSYAQTPYEQVRPSMYPTTQPAYPPNSSSTHASYQAWQQTGLYDPMQRVQPQNRSYPYHPVQHNQDVDFGPITPQYLQQFNYPTAQPVQQSQYSHQSRPLGPPPTPLVVPRIPQTATAYNAGRSASSTNQATYQQESPDYQAGYQAGARGSGLPRDGFTAEYEAGYQDGAQYKASVQSHARYQYQAGLQAGASCSDLPKGGYTAEYEAGYLAGILQRQSQILIQHHSNVRPMQQVATTTYLQQPHGYHAGAQYQAGLQAGASGAGLPKNGYTAEYGDGYMASIQQLQSQILITQDAAMGVTAVQQVPSTTVHRVTAAAPPKATTNVHPNGSPKSDEASDKTFEMKLMKEKIKELEEFIKGEVASIQKTIDEFNENFDNACKKSDEEKKKFEGMKKTVDEMEMRLKKVEEEAEKDIYIL